MSVTPKAKVLGLRSRMAKSRHQLEKENTDSVHSVHAEEASGKTASSEGFENSHCGSVNSNSSCMVTPVKTRVHTEVESPDIPQSSRFIQSLLPKAFGSPEIDVSWDWSSSQLATESGNSSIDSFVPKRKHLKTRTLNRRLPRALSPAVIFRSRLPLDKSISEEEQKKRVEFYRNLYNEIKGNAVETESSVKESILDNESKIEACAKRQDEKYEALFDDSNNEIMLECSQAIEEVFQVKDRVISNLSDPTEEPSSVINSHSTDLTSVKNILHEALDNTRNISMSDKEINNELRSVVVSEDDKLNVINKSDVKYFHGRTRTLKSKTEFKHRRQSFRGTEDDDIRVHKHQMDVTMLFNDDNDDELSSLAVDILPSIPGSKKGFDLETKRCSQIEIEEKRKQALRKLMKKKGISRK